MDELNGLRKEIDGLNRELLDLVERRARVVQRIARFKKGRGVAAYDPTREESMLRDLFRDSSGPFLPSELRAIFSLIFRTSLHVQQRELAGTPPGRIGRVAPVAVDGVVIGGEKPVLVFGPCSVESREQLDSVAAIAPRIGAPVILRGGAYKPRTHAESFQGLREEGVRLLRQAGDRHGIPIVTEVLDASLLDAVASETDMIQVGTRSMYNTELLKELGKLRIPVLLKRGFMASLDEVVSAVGYLRAGGNESIVICERGIRTFDYRTRNTLDIAAVPLLREELGLPVIVDVSHAVGRTDILLPCAAAALAAGADGLMFEVHPDPTHALSDAAQQITPDQLLGIVEALSLQAGGVRTEPGLGVAP
jgi:3-deoxy-7-phosphoheptulonate synthase/chorismate mutase